MSSEIKTYFMSVSVREMITNLGSKPNNGVSGIKDISTGESLTNIEAMVYYTCELAKGRETLPSSSSCGNPCSNESRGCKGFNFGRNGGCQGFKK
jgi:hypothetical protein